MPLTLTILRCPDWATPETRTVAGGEFSIGRGSDNNWVLPDPERVLSKHHCILAYRAGVWQIVDVSTNGTFLNGESEPIGSEGARDLNSGDRLRVGSYEIEVAVAGTAVAGTAIDSAGAATAADPFASSRAQGFAGDPALRPAAADDPFAVALTPPSINLPPDYDPLAPEPAEVSFAGPAQPDHSPHLEDAISPPVARSVLPEDWDRDLAAALPAAHEAPLPKTPAEAPQEVPPAPAEDLLAAFLRGTGINDVRPADPAAAMARLGAACRAVVSGLRQAMIARAAIKGEFRIEQTAIRRTGNNPLKFSTDDDDALVALLGAGRRGDMDAVEAVSDALRDMRLHEVATIAAMQKAVRALLAEFDPAKLGRAAGHHGLDFMPSQRKAHAWDAFEALYARVSQALADDFDTVFGRTFARAYEEALAEASAKDPG